MELGHLTLTVVDPIQLNVIIISAIIRIRTVSDLVPSEQSPAEQVSGQAELGGPVPLR